MKGQCGLNKCLYPECHCFCHLQTQLQGYSLDRKPLLSSTSSSSHNFNEITAIVLPRSNERLVDCNFKTGKKNTVFLSPKPQDCFLSNHVFPKYINTVINIKRADINEPNLLVFWGNKDPYSKCQFYLIQLRVNLKIG